LAEKTRALIAEEFCRAEKAHIFVVVVVNFASAAELLQLEMSPIIGT
jgi:hypothetical protein